MFNIGAVVAEFKADTANFTKGVKGANESVKDFASSTKSASASIGSSLSKVGKVAGTVGLVIGATLTAAMIKLGKTGLDTAKDFEQFEIAFTTLLGSAEKAQEALAAIEEDAKRTPFNLPDLVKANQLLISAGVSSGDAREAIMFLGDAISATGGGTAELNRLGANLQQIKAVGKASALDIKQFAFAGINIYGLLADKTGKSVEQVKDMDVTYELLIDTLKMASSEGGQFAGAMDNQSKSLQGVLSNLEDVISLTSKDIIIESGIFDIIKDAVESFVRYIEDNKEEIIAFFTQVGQVIKKLVDFTKEHPKLVAGIAAIIAVMITLSSVFLLLAPAITAIVTIAPVVGAVIGAISVPVLIVIAVIAALIAAGVLLYKNWETIVDKASETWNSIVEAFKNAGFLISSAMSDMKERVNTIIDAMMLAVIQYFFNMTFTVISILTQFITQSSSLFNDLKSKIISIVDSIRSTVQQIFDDMRSTVVSIIDSMRGALISAFDNIKSAIISKVNEIRSSTADGFNNIKNAGIDAINAMRAGISDAMGGVVSVIVGSLNDAWAQAVEIVNNIRSSIAAALSTEERNSPSIHDRLDMIKGMTENILGSIEVPSLSGSIADQFAIAQNQIGTMGANGMTVNQTVNANVSSGLDMQLLSEKLAYSYRNEIK